MGKVAIVGVEGSGKTTLMAAFGEKYERPDANGYALSPKEERTYALIHSLVGAMRNGKWPSVNDLKTVNDLSWTLLRRTGRRVDELGDFTFLDYAGEIYRLAFGQSVTDEEQAPHAKQIAALISHVESATALAVLVNLSDVIDGGLQDPRVHQMVFLTGELLRMAIQRVGAEHVALVFSQADKYREQIEELGGLPQVLERHLPLVATRFPDLRLFAVSAVGRTVVDKSGVELPAPDFQPTGLEELMGWMANGAKATGTPGWKIPAVVGMGLAALGVVCLFSGGGFAKALVGGAMIGLGILMAMAGIARARGKRPGGSDGAVTKVKVPPGPTPGEPTPGEERTITLPGGEKMTFCWCPATTSEAWKKISGGQDFFWMGSAESENGRYDNEPRHPVKLTQGCWMGKYPVTQRQWASVMGTNPSEFAGGDRRPVKRVSWDDCQEFIRKVNAAGTAAVALPTEAQWEYACRAGTTTPFSFGSALNGDRANCDGNYPYGTATKGRCRPETSPVGSYAPNAWGLHDMHGNVWEWCEDRYDRDFYTREEAKVDPCCASGSIRVMRGGSWRSYADYCRSARRYYKYPSDNYNSSGFRLCCSAGLQK